MRGALVMALLVAALSGCATRYVVLSNVPESPTFTVIPGSVSRANMEFSNTITTALVGCGVRVIERPALLSAYAESQSSVAGVGLGGAAASGGSIAGVAGIVGGGGKGETATQSSDVVELYEQTVADYVVVVFAADSWVKVVRRDTKAILFGGSLRADRNHQDRGYRREMSEVLRALGVAVRR